MEVEKPRYLIDQDALIALDRGELPNGPEILERLREGQFIDQARTVTAKGRAALQAIGARRAMLARDRAAALAARS
jgi:hypothetical protein